jgi:hypothetical protein
MVMQTNTALTALATATFPNNGTVSVANMHPGTFNNAYFNAAAGSGLGKLYVCGRGAGTIDRPTLFRIGFTAGGGTNLGSSVMNSAADAGSLTLVSSDREDCSPITEINNTAASTEWIFWSVGNNSSVPPAPSRCSTGAGTHGCLLALNLTALGATWPPAAGGPYLAGFRTPLGPTYTSIGGGLINAAGTSGIVVDNVANTVTFPQASSVYFSFTSNSTGGGGGASCNGAAGIGCAIKLTQSGLQ